MVKRTAFVDDNLVMRNIMKRKLEAKGVLVDTYENAFDLLAFLEKNPINYYDILLLDDMMPDMSGTEAMQVLKGKKVYSNYKGEIYINPIMVITSNSSPTDRDKYLNAGFDEYLSKDDIDSFDKTTSKFFFE